MSRLDLNNQAEAAAQIAPKFQALRQAMEARREIWDRLPPAKRRFWVKSGRDPVMTLAWQAHVYMREFFERTPDA